MKTAKEMVDMFANRLILISALSGVLLYTIKVYEKDTIQNVVGLSFFTIWSAFSLTNISLEKWRSK